jgi:lactoylglutathione lyase
VIEQIHSFAIFVNHLDRAIEFYRDTLGLPVHKQGSFGLELFREPPHLGVHPAVHPDAKALVGRHTGITFYVPGLLHFCGILHERGVRFVSEPTLVAWGVMAMIADPEDNVFALWDDSAPPEG